MANRSDLPGMLGCAALVTAISLSGCGDESGSAGYSGASDAYWMPFLATPAAAGGELGLFVVPSSELTKAPTFITHSSVQLLGEAQNYTLANSIVTAASPAVIMYSASDAHGDAHIYGLTLDNLDAAPTPVQVSSLSLPASSICYAIQGQTKLSRPETLYLILDIASGSGCGSQDTQLFVPLWASPSTPPTPIDIPADSAIQPLYGPDGTLGGMTITSASTMYFYPGISFSQPVTLLSGFTQLNTAFIPDPQNSGVFTDEEFVVARGNGGDEVYYRIDYSGQATQLAVFPVSFQFPAQASDHDNFYFNDPASVTIWRQRFAGGPPERIGDLSNNPLGSFLTPLVSNGTTLVVNSEAGAGEISSTLLSFPIGAFTTNPDIIAPYYDGPVDILLSSPVPGDLASSTLFMTVDYFNAVTFLTLQSIAIDSDGTVRQPLLTNSAFAPINPFGGDVFKITGIRAQFGGIGGGVLDYLDVATQHLTPMQTYGAGTAFVIPLDGGLEAISSRIGIVSGANTFVYDAAAKVVYPVTLQNTTVASLL